MNITTEDIQRLKVLRSKLFEAIRKALEIDGHCKSYEGAFQISLPNFFEERDGETNCYVLSLDCYVVGPSRHYEWRGSSLSEAISKAEGDINGWIDEAKEEYE